TRTTSTRAIAADVIRAQVIIYLEPQELASDCDGSHASLVAHLRSALASAVASADHSAGMTDGGSGHADTTNSGPTWAASQANLRDHAVRLRERRRRYCLCRSCDG